MLYLIFVYVLLGIVTNVSEDSYFDPEYLYEVNQTKIEHEEFDNITKIISTIIIPFKQKFCTVTCMISCQ